MHDSIVVEIEQALRNLPRNVLASCLGDHEVSLLHVFKEVAPFHVLKDDVVVSMAFEEVNQLDDVGVLTHLEHLDLFLLLIDLNGSDVFLLDNLDGYCLSGELVLSELH